MIELTLLSFYFTKGDTNGTVGYILPCCVWWRLPTSCSPELPTSFIVHDLREAGFGKFEGRPVKDLVHDEDFKSGITPLRLSAGVAQSPLSSSTPAAPTA